MVYRRRSTIFGLILGLGAGALQAAPVLTVVPDAPSLRMPVPETLYARGLESDFSNLEILGPSGERLRFAACPMLDHIAGSAEVPLTAVPDTARAVLAEDGSIQLDYPPGAIPPEQFQELIIDLRELSGKVTSLRGLPKLTELRSGPNLQQWSAPLRPRQQDGALLLAPAHLRFLKARLATPTDTLPGPVSAQSEQLNPQRQAHWFSPQAVDKPGRYQQSRGWPIFAARLQPPQAGQAWQLESRQGDWDAWKPRGGLTGQAGETRLTFSAVSDPQWKVTGGGERQLQLAHVAYELRLPDVTAGQPLTLVLTDTGRGRPGLDCGVVDDLRPGDFTMTAATDSPTHQQQGPNNLRGLFLKIVLSLAVVGIVAWRLIKARRKS